MYEPLNTAQSMLETQKLDTIKAGGPSSSALLNRMKQAIQDDLTILQANVEQNQQDLAATNTILSAVVTALTSRFNGLEASLPTATGRYLADFFTTTYISSGNAADISTLYGQATLPIASQDNKLVGTDARGQIWIPQATQLHYSYKATTPNEADWLEDDTAHHCLDGRYDTSWWRNRGSSGTVWVRVRVPQILTAGLLSNTIELQPFPPLTFDLNSVEYRSTDGSWTSADLSYVEGWNGSKVQYLGNARLFFSPVAVTELRLKLTVQDYWGFGWIGLKSTRFQSSANLEVTFAPYSLGSATLYGLYGKDQSSLVFPTTIGAGPTVLVQLTQSSAYVSPVLTGVEVR